MLPTIGRSDAWKINKPRKCCFQHTLFHRDLDLWPFDPKLWGDRLCPIFIMHRWCKFGENASSILQDIALTMFRDSHTSARTHGRTNRTKTVCLRPDYVWRRHKNIHPLWSCFINRYHVFQIRMCMKTWTCKTVYCSHYTLTYLRCRYPHQISWLPTHKADAAIASIDREKKLKVVNRATTAPRSGR